MAMRAHTNLVAIIEDDEPHGKALARPLESAGFPTALFGSAEAYLQAAFDREPHCLIIDVNLPGMSGIELMNLMASAGKAPPMIVTSALRERALQVREGSRGEIRFLAKPIDPAALLDAVSGA